MEKISELNKKCLSNMPILLDSIKMTLDTLKEEFSDIYKKNGRVSGKAMYIDKIHGFAT